MTQTNTDEKQFQDIDMRFGDSQKCMMSLAIQRRKNSHNDATWTLIESCKLLGHHCALHIRRHSADHEIRPFFINIFLFINCYK